VDGLSAVAMRKLRPRSACSVAQVAPEPARVLP